MNKPVSKNVSIMSLVVDTNVNIRDIDNYDIPAIKIQIASTGRILQAIVVKETEVKDIYLVLAGNRRTLAGQELYQEADCPSDLKEALSKVSILIYKDLTPSEELSLILDHGTQKGVNRHEMVRAVWRMDKAFYSEAQIANQLYFALAKYTGKELKLNSLSANQKLREAELKKWFHGTLGGYMLAAARMGPYVREQFLLTAKSEDKTLKEEEKLDVRMSRLRVTQLNAAKTGEKDVWTPEDGSPTFNELLEKFKQEDAGEIGKEKSTRPSVKDLSAKADTFSSPMLRKAFLLAAEGSSDKTLGLEAEDEEYCRMAKVFAVLRDQVNDIKDEALKSLINGVLYATAAQVKTALAPFVKQG